MSQTKNERRVQANEALAICHSIRTSPRKLNLVAQSIRGLSASKAVAVAAGRILINRKEKPLRAHSANREFVMRC